MRRTASGSIHLEPGGVESRVFVGAGGRAAVLSGLCGLRWRSRRLRRPTCPLSASTTRCRRLRLVIAPGPNTYINFLDEARVGVYAHNWTHDEGAPVDLSGELLSTPIGYANNFGGPWFSWFFNPRIHVGGMINTGGGTSYGFTGLTWRIPIYKGFFFEGEFGAAVNTSPLRDEPNRVNTGCRWDFREFGRLRLPVRRALGCHRQCRAHQPCEPVHPHQPGPDPGRGTGSDIGSSLRA